ncbi:MAG: hypothetical protein EBZ48_10210 [Proteobacteria bacterium]|nr:hypothetical protein [Pseudomonadota bacterium]
MGPWMHSALLRKPTKDGNVSHLLPSRIAQSPAPQDPQPHQKDAIKDIVAMLATEERAQAHMACGTGKTLVGQMVAHQMGSRNLTL